MPGGGALQHCWSEKLNLVRPVFKSSAQQSLFITSLVQFPPFFCSPCLWLQRVITRRSCCDAAARMACVMSLCHIPAPGAPSTSQSPGSASVPSVTAAHHTGARSLTQRCPPLPPPPLPRRPLYGPECLDVHLVKGASGHMQGFHSHGKCLVSFLSFCHFI